MSFIAAFTLVTLCGVVFYCVMIAKQTGDPVNRFSVFGAVAVLLLYIGVTLALYTHLTLPTT